MLDTSPNFTAIKQKQQAAWSSGNYAVIGTTLQIVGESLCEAMDLRAGSRVLDVAAGNGNATLAAARRFCDVTSTDYVPSLLEQGRRRAEAEGHDVTFQEADAENLPFADGQFDAGISTFGIMFTPDHQRSASEIARVVRSGGRIGLANWTPSSFVGQLFKTIGKYLPPPAGVKSPALWGTEEHLQELFRDTAATITATPKDFVFRYRTPDHWLEMFRDWYGPVNRAFAAMDDATQAAFTLDVHALMARGNRSGDRTLVLPSEYLEVVIVRK